MRLEVTNEEKAWIVEALHLRANQDPGSMAAITADILAVKLEIQAAIGPVMYGVFGKMAAAANWLQGFATGIGARFAKEANDAT